MAVVAIRQRGSTRGPNVWDFIAEDGPRLGTSNRIDLAKRFVDQAAIDAHVTARNGVTADWKAVTLPAGIE